MKATEKLEVALLFDTEPLKVGELIWLKNKIYFKYFEAFLEKKINISPFKLPFNAGVQQLPNTIFDGLFGVFNDSLPDGWGKLLVDRHLQSKGINIKTINPLDRLSIVGKTGNGALIYEPIQMTEEIDNQGIDLDFLHKEMQLVLSGTASEVIDELFIFGGSSGGARPKINVGYHPTNHQVIPSLDHLPEGFEPWIIKFTSSFDAPDAAQIEYVYHKMALLAGIEMMPCRLFQGKSGRYYFGTKRFDRNQNSRQHLHSISGLLHDDFRMSSLDYGHLMDAGFQLEKNTAAYEKIFRLATFNLFTHNRDDHSKNFSFLMDKNGIWRFAPAYDLTFSSSSMGTHSTSFAGEYKNPSVVHLKELAKVFGLNQHDSIIDEVKNAIQQWETLAKNHQVSNLAIKNIKNTILKSIKY